MLFQWCPLPSVQASHPWATRESLVPPDVSRYSKIKRNRLEASWKCHIWKCFSRHRQPATIRGTSRWLSKELHTNKCHCRFHWRALEAVVHSAVTNVGLGFRCLWEVRKLCDERAAPVSEDETDRVHHLNTAHMRWLYSFIHRHTWHFPFYRQTCVCCCFLLILWKTACLCVRINAYFLHHYKYFVIVYIKNVQIFNKYEKWLLRTLTDSTLFC